MYATAAQDIQDILKNLQPASFCLSWDEAENNGYLSHWQAIQAVLAIMRTTEVSPWTAFHLGCSFGTSDPTEFRVNLESALETL